MKIKQIDSYPVFIRDEDIIEAIHNLCIEELKEKIEKYKLDNPSKEIINFHLLEEEFFDRDAIIIEKIAIFDIVDITR